MSVTPGPWREDNHGLHKTFAFADFAHALAFVVAVGRRAEAADHHPDVDLRFDNVSLTLLTHRAGKVTEKDHSLARAVDLISSADVESHLQRIF